MLSFKATSGSIRAIQGKPEDVGTLIILSIEPNYGSSIQFDDDYVLRCPSKVPSSVLDDKTVSAELLLIRRRNCDAKELGSRGVDPNYIGAAYYDDKKSLSITACLDDDGFDLAFDMIKKGVLPNCVDMQMMLPSQGHESRNLRWHTLEDDNFRNREVKSLFFQYENIAKPAATQSEAGYAIEVDNYKKEEAERRDIALSEANLERITSSLMKVRFSLGVIAVLLAALAVKTFL